MTAPEKWTDADTALAWSEADTFRASPAALTPMLDADVVFDETDRGHLSWGFGLTVLTVVFLIPWAFIALVGWIGWLIWGVIR